MIYVTVGTMFLDFPRLVNAMDEIARDTREQVIVQTGMGKTLPAYCEHFDFKPREEVLEIQRGARVVVCHAGIGCVSDALRMQRPLIVVPRLKRYNEHMNDHQMDLARAVEARGWGRVILDVRELADACAGPPKPHESYSPASAALIDELKSAIASLTR
jgi:UDP-N-acetylglucosamine transferase subunit ALG13